MNDYLWLMRREFWENKSILIVPAVIGAALIVATLFGRIEIGDLTSLDQHRAAAGTALFMFGAVFIVAMALYCFWYLLDSLYADRKDKSVLFWKSLPISDTSTVLSKLIFGLLVIPLVYFAAADLSSLILAVILSTRTRIVGSSIWQIDLWLQLQGLWLYVICTAALWYLPVAGWLLLVSAWAKRAVILWATLPLLGAMLIESLFIGSQVVANTLGDRLGGYMSRAFNDIEHQAHWVTSPSGKEIIGTTSSVWGMVDPKGFLMSPATWIGVLVGAAMIAGAVQLRMRRSDP